MASSTAVDRNAYKALAQQRKAIRIALSIRMTGITLTRSDVQRLDGPARRAAERAAGVNISSAETWALVAEQFPATGEPQPVATPTPTKPCILCERPRIAGGLRCRPCEDSYQSQTLGALDPKCAFTREEILDARARAGSRNHPHYPVTRCAHCQVALVAQAGVYTQDERGRTVDLVCRDCYATWDITGPRPFPPGTCCLCGVRCETPSRNYTVLVHESCAAQASSEG